MHSYGLWLTGGSFTTLLPFPCISVLFLSWQYQIEGDLMFLMHGAIKLKINVLRIDPMDV